MKTAAAFTMHLVFAHQAMDQVEYLQRCGAPDLARRWAETARHNLACAEQLVHAPSTPRLPRCRAVKGGRP